MPACFPCVNMSIAACRLASCSARLILTCMDRDQLWPKRVQELAITFTPELIIYRHNNLCDFEAVFPGNWSDIIRTESPIFSLACSIFPSGNTTTPSFLLQMHPCKNLSPQMLPHQMWSNSTKTPWYRVLSIYGRFSSFQFLSLILIFFLHESIFTSLNIRTLKLTYYMMIFDCSQSAASKGYRYSNFLIRSSKFAK